MRDYLYVWNDEVNQCIVASGIEFKDIADPVGTNGGLVLLSYGTSYLADYTEYNKRSNFIYVPKTEISELTKEDIYSWGDFCWVDYTGESFPPLSDQEIAELLFFSHMGRPLEKIVLPDLNNRYMCYSHDDGWFIQLFYSSWKDVQALIGNLHPKLDIEDIESGCNAYWISDTAIDLEERSYDIDAILNRRM